MKLGRIARSALKALSYPDLNLSLIHIYILLGESINRISSSS